MKFAKRIPVEVWIIVVPAALLVSGYLLLGLIPVEHAYYPLGGILVCGAVSLVLFAILWLVGGVQAAVAKGSHADSLGTSVAILRRYGPNLAYVVSVLAALGLVSSLLAYALFSTASPAKTARVSQALMRIDYALFRTYPPVVVQKIVTVPLVEALVSRAYRALPSIGLALLTICVCIGRARLFRLFVIAYYTSFMMAYPLWYFFPAVSPHELIYKPSSMPPDAAIGRYVETNPPSAYLKRQLAVLERQWTDPRGELIAVSTNPSMHVAWGFIITYVAVALFAPSAVVMVPWFALNILGTLYLLQHYAVDAITGLLVGIVSVAFAAYVIDRTRSSVSPHYFAVFERLSQFWPGSGGATERA